MNLLKSAIKGLFIHINAAKFKRSINNGKLNKSLIIIMYHRVLPSQDARLASEEPGMYVTPETLEMHLNEYKKFAELIHIEQWQALAKEKQLEDKLYCAITFDDGWADNYEFALPLLKKYAVPATIFLTTDYIGSNSTFWPERLSKLLNNFEDYSAEMSDFFTELNVKLNRKKLVSKNKDYFAELIAATKTLTENQIIAKLNRIEKVNEPDDEVQMLSWAQSKALTEFNIRIGGHTRSHMRLNDKASTAQITEEVIGCQADIKDNLDYLATQFCYPNGDCSNTAQEIVERAFKLAVTTQHGINTGDTSPYALRRIGLHEDAANSPKKLLSRLASALNSPLK